MKYILIFLSLYMLQETKSPEDFIGKIMTKMVVGDEKLKMEQKTDEEILYSLNKMKFLGKDCRSFFIRANLENVGLEIFFGIDDKINNQFFDSMVKKYGTPSKMFKLKEDENIKRSKHTSINYSISSISGSATNCNFTEGPNFIIWNKLKYTISITLPPNENHTFISFRNNESSN